MSPTAGALIEREGARYVEEWRECCRIPSVTGGSRAHLDRMAMWLLERMEPIFDRVDTVGVPGHPPVVIGEIEGTGPARLLVYSHYDVQPVGDEALWSSPPFGAEVRDGCVYARGCCDDKADLTARLQALEALLATQGRPPFSVVWLSEGAEEIGSPGLEDVLAANASRLAADACLWESYVRRADGRPEIAFGCRGVLAARLSVRFLAADQHAAFSPIFRSAPAFLAGALASLVDENGRVLVEGFSDDVAALEPRERELAAAIMPSGETLGVGGRSPFVPELSAAELGLRIIEAPTANISAIEAGDVASNLTVVPATAEANVDFHLVPEQDPDDVLRKVVAHLGSRGFDAVEVDVRTKLRPARGSTKSSLARAAISAARDVYGEPVLYPLLPGAGPGRLFAEHLGATIVSPAGTTRLESGIHGPDEHGAIDDYLDHVRFSLSLFEHLGRLSV